MNSGLRNDIQSQDNQCCGIFGVPRFWSPGISESRGIRRPGTLDFEIFNTMKLSVLMCCTIKRYRQYKQS